MEMDGRCFGTNVKTFVLFNISTKTELCSSINNTSDLHKQVVWGASWAHCRCHVWHLWRLSDSRALRHRLPHRGRGFDEEYRHPV